MSEALPRVQIWDTPMGELEVVNPPGSKIWYLHDYEDMTDTKIFCGFLCPEQLSKIIEKRECNKRLAKKVVSKRATKNYGLQGQLGGDY